MKTPTRFLIIFAVVSAKTSLIVADTPMLVGDLGRTQVLAFEGNRTFTKEQIVSGLTWHIDYHLAANPAAPLPEYLACLERKIRLGYQHAGFPDVRVKATFETNADRIMIAISEGVGYRCGDIVVTGSGAMTNEVVRQKIRDALHGAPVATLSQETNLTSGRWMRSLPAPFDEYSKRHFIRLVQQGLADMNYFRPTVNINLKPDPARKLADLEVQIADEGIKGTVEEIEVTGLRTNTTQHFLEYLRLKPGMELSANLVNTVSNQLWHSARFFRRDVILNPLPKPGKFKLVLHLEELRNAPPLGEDFSPEAKALLNLRDWLMNWQNRPEDLVLSVTATSSGIRGRGDLVVSPSGSALAFRAVDGTQTPLTYAVIASPELIGLYSLWRQSKLAFPVRRGDTAVRFFVNIEPKNTALGFGLSNKGSFTMDWQLDPLAFVAMAHDMGTNVVFKNGIAALSGRSEAGDWSLEFEASTGRLINLVCRSKKQDTLMAAAHFEEGAYARLLREVAAASAKHRNEYIPKQALSLVLFFLTTDAITSPVIDPMLEESHRSGDGDKTLLAAVRQVRPFLDQAREIVRRGNFANVFKPLNRLFIRDDVDEHEEDFSVPIEDVIGGQTANPTVTWACGLVLAFADQVFTPGSWPWVLLRESAFTLAGQGKYSQGELDKLLTSENFGPLGCLAAAFLVGKTNPKIVRVVAEQGLSRLSSSEFRKDYAVLLDADSIAGEMLANILGLLQNVTEAELTVLTSKLKSADAQFIRDLGGLVRSANRQTVAEAAWPAFEQHWGRTWRPYLQAAFSKALYECGLALVSANSVMRDFDQAAQCFRKAAEQGHAGAQMSLGNLLEHGQGLRQDFAEAMRWYRKAAEQKEPHATCRVADLYRDGKGVDKSLDEAAKWYRTEAEGKCLGAQFNLGRISEAQHNMPEALKWYRRAAEGGNTDAQAYLGDILSDGITLPPDYVEACQWLMLAVQSGHNRILEMTLRRVKAKMNPVQLEEAHNFFLAKSIPPRKADADPNLINLSAFYNASLQEAWLNNNIPNLRLSELPIGQATLGGSSFDIRGAIQLASTRLNTPYPKEVIGIRVHQTCRRLHFLHATGWNVSDGTQIGSYMIHYADGERREIPILYGEHVRDFTTSADKRGDLGQATEVWTQTTKAGYSLRLFKSTWENPRAEIQIETIDFISSMTACAPFLIALTAE